MKVYKKFECEICGRIYESEEAARRCETQPIPKKARIKSGDIVLAQAGFDWFDGDKKWVSNYSKFKLGLAPKSLGKKCPKRNSNCFDSCCTYAFYYVVGKVEVERTDSHSGYILDKVGEETVYQHRWKFHLFTLAMTGKTGYSNGYTFDKGHVLPEKVKNPPKLPGIERFLKRKRRSKYLL